MFSRKSLTVIVAPSCAGKDYLSECLISNFPNQFEVVVSSTTRSPRSGEIDGVDYNFLSEDEFSKLEDNKSLLESACFGGKKYGTSKFEIDKIQKNELFPILIIEPQGAINIWNWCHEKKQKAQFLFIDVDREVALERFIKRFIKDRNVILTKCSALENAKIDKLIDSYSKRIFISLYEESEWKNALPYTMKLGKMITPVDSLIAAEKIVEGLKGEGPGVPDNLLSFSKNKQPILDSNLKEMAQKIKKILSVVKKDYLKEDNLKKNILKCEYEQLNKYKLDR